MKTFVLLYGLGEPGVKISRKDRNGRKDNIKDNVRYFGYEELISIMHLVRHS